ncbi:hypothetical protein CAEBREN_01577 [Caenorhabditis brenneri]|uniref:RNA-directed DNA polymerase n=1 Tax=Caenorhabditis brenneri TaxID=135651 RepID=G0MWG3_CAEBE|nr:hypothetical protein CAEBREN_01577 [Caenorhabditis brenneri]
MVNDNPQQAAEAAEIPQPAHDQVVQNPPSPHDQVVLSITDCLPNIRSMKQSVTTDITNLHERVKFLANLQAARIEAVETSIRETNARLAVLEQRETSETPRQQQEKVGFRTPPQGKLPNPPHPRDLDPELFQPLEDEVPAVPGDLPRDPAAPMAKIIPPAPPLPAELGTPSTIRQRKPAVLVSVLGHKMPTTIPVFSGGTNENFSTFTRSFSDHVNASKHTLDDTAKRAVFLTYLSEYARDKAEELLEETPNSSFESLVAEMKKTFEDPNRAEMERQQLRQCIQRSDETVDQYGERVRKLAQSAYAGKSRDFIHDKAKEAFTEGLLFNLKFHVKGESPKSFQEAQHSAVKFEMLLAEAAKANTIAPQGLMAMAPQQQKQSQKKGECYYCGIKGHYASECRGKIADQSKGIFLKTNKKVRNQRSKFQKMDPVQNHQIQSQPAVQSIQAAPHVLVAQLEALQADNATKQQQIAALIKRNDELATAPVSSNPGMRVNCLSWATTTTLAILAISCLLSPVQAFEPLVCMPHAPTQILKLPRSIDCSKSMATDPVPVESLSLSVYRPNTVAYEANATLCKVVTMTTRYSVNLFGAKWKETFSKQERVTKEKCEFMQKFKKCGEWDLVLSDGIYRTQNAHSIDWPDAPWSAFKGTYTTETTNCFMLDTVVSTRFGQEVPESPSGPMRGCKFTSGFCNTREGAAFIWTPNYKQECKFIKMETMKGFKSNNIWISESKEFALSYSDNSTTFIDCRNQLVLTDQGYAIALSRNKRSANNDTSFVTSNQLAAQLLASEKAVLGTTAAWISHNFLSWCSSINAIAASTGAAVASSPTLAARQLMKQDNIHAKYIGEGFLSVQVCSSVPKGSYEFIPFTDKCYSKPALRITLPEKLSIVTFVDLSTRIITNRAHSVECSLVTSFQYVANNTLHSLDPFTLKSSAESDFLAETISETKFSSERVPDPLIFHNMVIGSTSENIQSGHYNEIWEALQGSEEAIKRIISTHSDPSSGSLATNKLESMVSFWERAKYVWDVLFYLWTLFTNLVISTLIVTLLVLALATNFLAPFMPKWPQQAQASEPTETPVVNITNYADITDRLRSPRVNSLGLPSQDYFTAQIPIKANGINCWALIDTGASFTVASQAICPLLGISKLQRPTAQTALGLGGNEVTMAGSGTVRLQIGSHTLFQAVHFTVGQCTPSGARDYDFIIGNDALARLPKFHLDYTNGIFEIGNDKLPLGIRIPTQIFPSRYPVHVLTDTIIPANSEAFVKCVIPKCHNTQDLVLVSQANTLTEQDLVVAPAVIASGKATLLVTNPTNEPKRLIPDAKPSQSPDDIVEQDPEFKVDLSHAKVSDKERKDLASLIEEYHDVFSKNAYDLGSSTTDPVHIYTNTEVPVRARPYRVPVKYQAELEKHINSLIKSGRITESNTPWTSPIVLVKKKNGSLRVCLDFRRLNDVTIPDNFPLPRIDAILERVGGSKYFTSMDMANGYLQLRLDPSSSYKCGFITETKVYAYTHLPFGLKSAASYFQRALKTVLAGLEDDALVYIDDILVFSKTFEQHLLSLRKVLDRFRSFNLKASPKKCEFAKTSITFLGHEISQNSYAPNKANVDSIAAFPVPSNINEVRRYVGMAGFFRKFIPNFSEIAEPLTRLTRKNTSFEWNSAQQEAFETLRTALISEPILGFPDYDKPFHIFCDASAVAQGAALMQTRPDSEKEFTAIAYASRTLSDPETRWPAIQVEMGAIIFALRQFKPYTCMSKIVLHSDHKPLTFLLQKSKTHDNLARWLIELQCYDITIVHIDGKKNTVADCLSRARDNEDPAEHTELKDIVNFPVCMVAGFGPLCSTTRGTIALVRRNKESKPLDIAAEQEKDDDVRAIKQFLEGKSKIEALPTVLQKLAEICSLTPNGTVMIKPSPQSRKTVLLVPDQLRMLVFEAFHESFLSGGHFNWKKTKDKIARKYYWPGMAKQVRELCRVCDKCQKKNSPVPAYRERLLTVATTGVFQKVGLDLTGPLRTTERNNKYILNIICWFSKFVVSVALPDARAETVARALFVECLMRYGAMSEIVTDNARTFDSHAFSDFCDLLTISHHKAIPYHSKGNGATERTFRTFHQLTSKYVNKTHTDWDLILPALTFCYNTSIHCTTGETPFFLMHGRDPIFSIDKILDPTPATESPDPKDEMESFREELTRNVRDAWTHAKEQADKARQQFSKSYDTAVKPTNIKVGDRVLMKNYKSKVGLSRKLVLPWIGQFRVIKIEHPEAQIQDISNPTAKPKRVHLDQIKKYFEISGPAATRADSLPDSGEVSDSSPLEPTTDLVVPIPDPIPVIADPVNETSPAQPNEPEEEPTEEPAEEPVSEPRYNLRGKVKQPDRYQAH